MKVSLMVQGFRGAFFCTNYFRLTAKNDLLRHEVKLIMYTNLVFAINIKIMDEMG